MKLSTIKEILSNSDGKKILSMLIEDASVEEQERVFLEIKPYIKELDQIEKNTLVYMFFIKANLPFSLIEQKYLNDLFKETSIISLENTRFKLGTRKHLTMNTKEYLKIMKSKLEEKEFNNFLIEKIYPLTPNKLMVLTEYPELINTKKIKKTLFEKTIKSYYRNNNFKNDFGEIMKIQQIKEKFIQIYIEMIKNNQIENGFGSFLLKDVNQDIKRIYFVNYINKIIEEIKTSLKDEKDRTKAKKDFENNKRNKIRYRLREIEYIVSKDFVDIWKEFVNTKRYEQIKEILKIYDFSIYINKKEVKKDLIPLLYEMGFAIESRNVRYAIDEQSINRFDIQEIKNKKLFFYNNFLDKYKVEKLKKDENKHHLFNSLIRLLKLDDKLLIFSIIPEVFDMELNEEKLKKTMSEKEYKAYYQKLDYKIQTIFTLFVNELTQDLTFHSEKKKEEFKKKAQILFNI